MPATSPSGSRSLERAQAARALGEEARGVEDERELGDLARLELQRAGAEPALGAVDLDAEAGELDEHEQAERDREQRAGRAQRPAAAAGARRADISDEPGGAVHEVLACR